MTFDQVIKQIYTKSPLQKKKLESYLATQPRSFFKEANKFISDYSGYFSFVARENDTIVFSYIGYKPILFVIPDTLSNPRYSIIQMMNKDTVRLQEIEIYPWPSKEQFKEAFINLDVPDDDYYRAMQNLALAEMRDRRKGSPMGANMNQVYAIQQQQTMLYNSGQLYPTTNLLNPVAWAKFIDSWRKGELKIEK